MTWLLVAIGVLVGVAQWGLPGEMRSRAEGEPRG
jgi:hypothetical protein